MVGRRSVHRQVRSTADRRRGRERHRWSGEPLGTQSYPRFPVEVATTARGANAVRRWQAAMTPGVFRRTADPRLTEHAEPSAMIIDGALELFRHPNPALGWSPDAIDAQILAKSSWPLDLDLMSARE